MTNNLIKDIVQKAINNLYIISGISAECMAENESPVSICTNIIDGVFMNLSSEFDETMTNNIKQLASLTNSLGVETVFVKNTYIKLDMLNASSIFKLKYRPDNDIANVLAKTLSGIKLADVMEFSIFKTIENDWTFMPKLLTMRNDSTGERVCVDHQTPDIAMNEYMNHTKQHASVLLSLEVDTLNNTEEYYKNIRNDINTLINFSTITTESVYRDLKAHKEYVERDIACNYKNGKYQNSECCLLAMQSILFAAKVFLVTQQILTMYISAWNTNLKQLLSDISRDRYNLIEAVEVTDSKYRCSKLQSEYSEREHTEIYE